MCVLILLGLGRMGHSIRLLSWHWNPPLVTSQPDAAPPDYGIERTHICQFSWHLPLFIDSEWAWNLTLYLLLPRAIGKALMGSKYEHLPVSVLLGQYLPTWSHFEVLTLAWVCVCFVSWYFGDTVSCWDSGMPLLLRLVWGNFTSASYVLGLLTWLVSIFNLCRLIIFSSSNGLERKRKRGRECVCVCFR